jgi:hypothetical protein
MLELPPIEQIEFFPPSLHLSGSTECLHPCHIWEKYKVFQMEMVDITWSIYEVSLYSS